jgi:protoporphyrinogen oxidase
MAVSSIGELDNGRYSICLENGLLLDARALIVALPARYAERLFYGYITSITEALLYYEYDSIHRVALVCRSDELPQKISNPPDMAYAFIHLTEDHARIADGYTLLQFGLRLTPDRVESPEQLVNFLQERFNLPEPVAYGLGFWAEADPISCYDDAHTTWVNDIRAQLPETIALIGSDYSHQAPCYKGISYFDERIKQGQTAAKQMLAALDI